MDKQDVQEQKVRRITNLELADLPEQWLNSTVDLRHYIQVCLTVYEVNKEIFELAKREGVCCQAVEPNRRNGNTIDRYCVGW
jgi:hypothetical protein